MTCCYGDIFMMKSTQLSLCEEICTSVACVFNLQASCVM